MDGEEYLKCIRDCCGTWTRAEFLAILDKSKLSKQDKNIQLAQFDASASELEKFCREQCYDCAYDVTHEIHLSGGAPSLTSILKSVGVTSKPQQKKNNKKKPTTTAAKGSGGSSKSNISIGPPRYIEECRNYDKDTGCVRDQNNHCINEKDVFGFGDTAISDGYCYNAKDDGNEALQTSPYTGKPLTEADRQIMKNPMTKEQAVVEKTCMQQIMSKFTTNLDNFQKDQQRKWEEKEKMPKANKKSTKQNMLEKAGWTAAGAAAAAATGGLGFLAYGAAAGLFASFDAVRKFVTTTGVSIAVWVIKNPRTALLMLYIVKAFMRRCCREFAVRFGYAQYKRESKMSQITGAVSGFVGDTLDMSGGTIIRAVTRGEGWKKLWKSGGKFLAEGAASLIPGGMLVKSGASLLVGSIVDAAEEATQLSLEVVAFQKDLDTGMTYIGDIIEMLLNPARCVRSTVVKYSSCAEMATDPRQCMMAPECKFIEGPNPARNVCREMACSEYPAESCPKTCSVKNGKCQPRGWFGGGDAIRLRALKREVQMAKDSGASRDEILQKKRAYNQMLLDALRQPSAADAQFQ